MTELTEQDIRQIVVNALRDSLPRRRLTVSEFRKVEDKLVVELKQVT